LVKAKQVIGRLPLTLMLLLCLRK